MTSVLFFHILTILFLIMTGFAFLQLIQNNRIRILQNLPYSLPVGMILLYIMSYPLLRLDIFSSTWYLYIFALGGIVIIGAIIKYRNSELLHTNYHFKFRYGVVLFIIILLISVILFYILLHNPVVDSDATGTYRHLGLAKYIFWEYPLSQTTAYNSHLSTEIAPPALHAFINTLQERWHDSVATLHYFFIYLWILLLSFFIGFNNTMHNAVSILATFIIATIPIALIHIIRPGYADIIVTMFFLMAINIIFTILKAKNVNKYMLILSAITYIGLLVYKPEGIIWSSWFAMVILSLYLFLNKHILWKKIISVQVILFFVGFSLYLLSAEWIYNNIDLSERLSFIFDLQYNPDSFQRFFDYIFFHGGQGLIWWMFIISSILIFIKSNNTTFKVIVLYAYILLLGIFYFSNFTFNITYTLQGTNVGRFLLQVSPLILLPYYFLLSDNFIDGSKNFTRKTFHKKYKNKRK